MLSMEGPVSAADLRLTGHPVHHVVCDYYRQKCESATDGRCSHAIEQASLKGCDPNVDCRSRAMASGGKRVTRSPKMRIRPSENSPGRIVTSKELAPYVFEASIQPNQRLLRTKPRHLRVNLLLLLRRRNLNIQRNRWALNLAQEVLVAVPVKDQLADISCRR